ncbi:hypothetical protein TNIN_395631 [Trichonephila inaurata madagascariensis]|uniref:Uncharacterized protein n=1 Tax=Trichonephila inaurata madagascariensis TaxID=2747483 RepID=A0A8X6YDE0_9ARAC|nr:hypothetical protein TNIN_395631 [Trichonephila inaurata madagascariensis]
MLFMAFCNEACLDHQITSTIVVSFVNVRRLISTLVYSPDEIMSRKIQLTDSEREASGVSERRGSMVLPGKRVFLSEALNGLSSSMQPTTQKGICGKTADCAIPRKRVDWFVG